MPTGVDLCGVLVPDRIPLDLLVRCARHVATEASGQLERSDAPPGAVLFDVLEPELAVTPEDLRGWRLELNRLPGVPFLGVDLWRPDADGRDVDARTGPLVALAEVVARQANDVAVAWWTLDVGAEEVHAFRGETSLLDEELTWDEAVKFSGRPPAKWPLGVVAAGIGRERAQAEDVPVAELREGVSAPLDASVVTAQVQAGLGPSCSTPDVATAVDRLANALDAAARGRFDHDDDDAPPARAAAEVPDQRGAYMLLIGLAALALVLTVVFSIMAAVRG